MALAALVFAAALTMPAGEVRTETPPLEAYGASPAVTRMDTGQHMFAASIGEARVRDLSWIGEQRVLIVASETQSIRELEVPRSELFYGMILDLETAMLAEMVNSPLLLIHGKDDTVVPIEQSRVMAEAMGRAGKPVELVELPGEDHWLSRTDTRQQMLRETVRFLEANNPIGPTPAVL